MSISWQLLAYQKRSAEAVHSHHEDRIMCVLGTVWGVWMGLATLREKLILRFVFPLDLLTDLNKFVVGELIFSFRYQTRY